MSTLKVDSLAIDTVSQKNSLFYSGPAEFLCYYLAENLRLDVAFNQLFSETVFPYKREDFSFRELPAIRIYNDSFRKLSESWFIEGDVKLDVIFPASLRRDELQQVQDTITAALVQHFRRPSLFTSLEANVPGLNELGKEVSADKSLGFMLSEDTIAPLSQLTLNFKIDLRMWDEFLEQTNRTKDSPFCEVIGDLNRLISTIQGLRVNQAVEVELKSDQNL